MFIAILGREPKISLAELESYFGPSKITPLSNSVALVASARFPLERFGGCIKAARTIDTPLTDFFQQLPPGKITLGFSDYSPRATARSTWQIALKYKNLLKRHQRNVRLVGGKSATLSSATSHHNQLGEKLNHIEIIKYKDYLATSIGSQNITAYARRDQARPARDAFVGMLPPKLAQILVNLATNGAKNGRLLDPFCGTGTILQEALLMGYNAYGSDLSPKMVSYSAENLAWLSQKDTSALPQFSVITADATQFVWQPPISFVASEIYLGQPLSSPPNAIKLQSLQQDAKALLLGFLRNLHPQLNKHTTLALAIPAWRRPNQSFATLQCLDDIKKLGYNVHKFKHAAPQDLLYYRENQIVARQIIVLRKA